ncbi:hypothetical protein D322_2309 [Yersinia enterocolitica IP 10393]|nr:hypothetical protein D322_2309 [Yersinia enterocolitica IP 10393]
MIHERKLPFIPYGLPAISQQELPVSYPTRLSLPTQSFIIF